MPLQVGVRLGPYEVLALIGAGGMGEVYQAKDTKLGRDVAIKVLPDAVAGDPDRLARFHREAQVLASLNHPNIAHIHGYEESSGVSALVMELVEGPTLADRIAPGPIPLNEALPIARQIAEALEAAHEQGIIHRDLKPANVKVREDGTVKVLDFGLAKMMDPASGSGLQAPINVTGSPTITTPAMMTGIGVILGTAAYMSPEQAKGRPADRRSDVWAFGCVLYEMLTGKCAFAGDDVTEVLASVIRSTPDWTPLPQLPPLVDVFLRQSLEKDWKKRLGDIREFRLAIEGAFDLAAFGGGGARPDISARFSRGQVAAAVVIVAAAAAIGLGVSRLRPAVVERPAPVVRFEVFPPAGGQFPGANLVPRMELSPDGRYLAFTATQADTSAQQLWVRRLDSTEARALTTFPEIPGEPVQQPFWSPDSQSIGFFIDGTLRRIAVDGSGMQTLATMSGNNYRGSWSADGTILFSSVGTAGLRRVTAAGGTSTQVTKLQAGETSHLWPQFLPDGRHFLYLALGADGSEVFGGSIDSPARTSVQKSSWMPRFVLPGYLLFFRNDSLMAQRFDPQTLALQGEPALLADQVQQPSNGRPGVTASDTGVLAFRRGTTSQTADSQLTWVDRSGRELSAVGPEANLRGIALSLDGRYAAVHREDGEAAGDIWILDLERNTMGRMTFDPQRHNVGPVWSPDGKSVIFSKVRGGLKTGESWSMYQRNADGTGEERLLFEAGAVTTLPWTVSPDGSTLLFSSGTNREVDLWTLQLRGASSPQRYLQAPGRQFAAQFSPDGRWVAYASDETGRSEIYVQSYPQPGTKYQVSGGGGQYPRWRRDGRELLYRSLASGTGLGQPVSAVPVETVAASLRFGTPATLFNTAVVQVHVSPYFDYAPSADGQKFLRLRRSGALGNEASRVPVTVVVNWTEEMKRLVPTK